MGSIFILFSHCSISSSNRMVTRVLMPLGESACLRLLKLSHASSNFFYYFSCTKDAETKRRSFELLNKIIIIRSKYHSFVNGFAISHLKISFVFYNFFFKQYKSHNYYYFWFNRRNNFETVTVSTCAIEYWDLNSKMINSNNLSFSLI